MMCLWYGMRGFFFSTPYTNNLPLPAVSASHSTMLLTIATLYTLAVTLQPECEALRTLYQMSSDEGSCCQGAVRSGEIHCDAPEQEDADLPRLFDITHNRRFEYSGGNPGGITENAPSEIQRTITIPVPMYYNDTKQFLTSNVALDLRLPRESYRKLSQDILIPHISRAISNFASAGLPVPGSQNALCNTPYHTSVYDYMRVSGRGDEQVYYAVPSNLCIDESWFVASHQWMGRAQIAFKVVADEVFFTTQVTDHASYIVARIPLTSDWALFRENTNASRVHYDNVTATYTFRLRRVMHKLHGMSLAFYNRSLYDGDASLPNNHTIFGDDAQMPYFEQQVDVDMTLTAVSRVAGEYKRERVPSRVDAFVQKGSFSFRVYDLEISDPTIYAWGHGIGGELTVPNVTEYSPAPGVTESVFTGLVFTHREVLSTGANIRGHTLTQNGFNAYVTRRSQTDGPEGSNGYTLANAPTGRPWTTVFAAPAVWALDIKTGVPTLHSYQHEAAQVLLHELVHTTQFSNYPLTANMRDYTRGGSWEGGATFLEMHPIGNVANTVMVFRDYLLGVLVTRLNDGTTILPKYNEYVRNPPSIIRYEWCLVYMYFSRYDIVHPSTGLRVPEFYRRVIREYMNSEEEVYAADNLPGPGNLRARNLYRKFYDEELKNHIFKHFTFLTRDVYDKVLTDMGRGTMASHMKNMVLAMHVAVGETRGAELNIPSELLFPDFVDDLFRAMNRDTMRETYADQISERAAPAMKSLVEFGQSDAPPEFHQRSIDTIVSETFNSIRTTGRIDQVRIGVNMERLSSSPETVFTIPPNAMPAYLLDNSVDGTHTAMCSGNVSHVELVLMRYTADTSFLKSEINIPCDGQNHSVPISYVPHLKIFMFNPTVDHPSESSSADATLVTYGFGFPPPQPGESLSTAIDVTYTTLPHVIPFATRSGDGRDPLPYNPGCNYVNQMSHDVFFRFTPPTPDEIVFSTCDGNSFDTSMTLYDCTSGTCAEIACNGDYEGGPADLGGCQQYYSGFVANVDSNRTYVLRLGGYSDNDFGTGTVTMLSLPPPPPPSPPGSPPLPPLPPMPPSQPPPPPSPPPLPSYLSFCKDDNPDFQLYGIWWLTCDVTAYYTNLYGVSCETWFSWNNAAFVTEDFEQECPQTCGTARCPRCTDDPDFVDRWGYACSDNVGLDCSTFVDVYDYTPEQQLDVQLSCPEACTDVAPGCPPSTPPLPPPLPPSPPPSPFLPFPPSPPPSPEPLPPPPPAPHPPEPSPPPPPTPNAPEPFPSTPSPPASHPESGSGEPGSGEHGSGQPGSGEEASGN